MSSRHEPEAGELEKFTDGKASKKKDERFIGDRVIINPGFESKMLTPREALDLINHLSAALLIHGSN